jgi:hypothetical protein
MGISNSEHIARIGLVYSRATRVKAEMLLNIEHIIFSKSGSDIDEADDIEVD